MRFWPLYLYKMNGELVIAAFTTLGCSLPVRCEYTSVSCSQGNLFIVSVLTGPRPGTHRPRRYYDPRWHLARCSLFFLLLYPLASSSALRCLFYLAVASPLPSSHSQRRPPITAMGVFAFHDAYPETADVSEDESDGEQADFDIDSDASDADLLELKQELNELGPERAQRDLADATVAAQKVTLQRWKRYAWTSVLSQLHFVISTAEADSVSSSSVPGIATLYARITCNCSSTVQSCPSELKDSGNSPYPHAMLLITSHPFLPFALLFPLPLSSNVPILILLPHQN